MTNIYRNRDDKIIFGVCGGLAKYFGVDSILVRLIFIVATLYHGSGILLYIILAIIMPEEKGERVESVEGEKLESERMEETEVRRAKRVGVTKDASKVSTVSTYETSTEIKAKETSKEERKNILALGLIVIGAYFLLRDFISVYVSSSQILGIILLLLGIALILKKR